MWAGNTATLAGTRCVALVDQVARVGVGISAPSTEALGTVAAAASVVTVAAPFLPGIEVIFTAVACARAVSARRRCKAIVKNGRAQFDASRAALATLKRARANPAQGSSPAGELREADEAEPAAPASPVSNRRPDRIDVVALKAVR